MWVGSSSCSVSSASTRLPDTTSFSASTAAAAFSASVRSGDGSTWIHATCAGTVPTTTGSVTKSKARKKSASRLHVPEEPVSAGTTEVFTDGACRGNPGPGGWAWAVPDGAQGSGHDPATTNQRMEVRRLRGDRRPARRARGGQRLDLPRELLQELLVDGLASPRVDQLRQEACGNRDLWGPLIDLVELRGDVTFRRVKGHSGHPMNDLVDQLAVEASHRAG
jgi:ribonuclease HI